MIYLNLFLTFFKIGLFTIGGGYAMLPLIQEEVIKNSWIEPEQLIDFIAISESTPGPFAINMATFVGSTVGGIFGSICTTFGVVLPSFIIILIVAKCYMQFKSSKLVKGAMSGLKPAVVGLIAGAVVMVALEVFLDGAGFVVVAFQDPFLYVSLAIFAVALVCTFKKVHPIAVIVGSAVIGIATGYLIP